MQPAATPNPDSHRHVLYHGDSRNLAFLPDECVHLAVTSPPYWNLKKYSSGEQQLGNISDYEEFLSELSKVWSEIFRILVPGGRLVCVVGDVCVSRRKLILLSGIKYRVPVMKSMEIQHFSGNHTNRMRLLKTT
jgi:site-specific DNA-methyltransferase (adenine-specific)